MLRSAVLGLALLSSSCVLTYGIGEEKVLPAPPAAPVPGKGPIDILFVVDNSGSMANKQQILARAIYKPECPISDLTKVPESLQNPPPDTRANLAEVCGFSQLLAADGRDFRLGVITTDVDACDNLIPGANGAPADWGFHPQRGCLQPVPATGQKVISRGDVDVEGKFTSIVTSVGTFGSPFERGLDAAEAFLTHDTWVADGCDGDRDAFLRDDAELLIVFVTDEDDCSHEDGATAFPDETVTTCGAVDGAAFFTANDPSQCYSRAQDLEPVQHYAEIFAGLKSDPSLVNVGVIAGSVESGGELVAAGCLTDPSGGPSTTSAGSACFPSGGLSNFTGAGQPCDPDSNGGRVCCTADPAQRYFSLRGQVGFTAGSICSEAFVQPLIDASGT